MDKADNAVEVFNDGFNCSQAVFSAFCEDFGLDAKLGLKIASSFGAGMGYMGEVCGAVTGAFMVLGLKYGSNVEHDSYSKAMTYLKVKDFAARFRKLNGSINCKDLVQCDLSDEKQREIARQNGVFETKCSQCVKDAVLLLETMISE